MGGVYYFDHKMEHIWNTTLDTARGHTAPLQQGKLHNDTTFTSCCITENCSKKENDTSYACSTFG